MKKLLLALALGVLLVLAIAATATADNGPHGGFAATTDACASCHRLHSAKYGSNALLIMDPEALCLSCHDGSGAGTDVVDGVYMQSGSDAFTGVPGSHVEGADGASLFAGGFTNALMATTWSGATTTNPAFDAVSKNTTSTHGMSAGATWQLGVAGTVWGSGANGTVGNGGTWVLECTSCHDPHGNAGYTNLTTQTAICDTALLAANPVTEACSVKVNSYRLLRWQPQGSGGYSAPATSTNWSGGAFPVSGTTTGWTVPDNYTTLGTEWYTIGAQTLAGKMPFAAGDYSAGNGDVVYQPLSSVTSATQSYIPAAVNTAFFCAQCHDRYFNNSKLRNNTDVSMYCGNPFNATTPPYTGSPLFLPLQADADGVAPWINPVDPVRCEPVFSAGAGVLTGWGDNGDSGDTTFMYRHASGDIRISADGATAAGAGTTVSRSCIACHVAHGTTSAMTTKAGTADDPLAVPPVIGASLAGGSTLLRMDNRSICLRCHAGNVGYTVAP